MNEEEEKKIALRFFYEGVTVGRHYTGDDAGNKYMSYMFDYAWDNYKGRTQQWKK